MCDVWWKPTQGYVLRSCQWCLRTYYKKGICLNLNCVRGWKSYMHHKQNTLDIMLPMDDMEEKDEEKNEYSQEENSAATLKPRFAHQVLAKYKQWKEQLQQHQEELKEEQQVKKRRLDDEERQEEWQEEWYKERQEERQEEWQKERHEKKEEQEK
jgi:hypothetical protein